MLIFLEYNLGKIENSYTYKKKNFENSLSKIQVINLGSSHGDMAFDPDYYNYEGFNLANSSQSLYYDYQILNKYINKVPRLKVLIIPVSYFSLGYKLIDSPEYWRGFFYENIYSIPMENNSKSKDLKRFSLIARYGYGETLSYITNGFNLNLTKSLKPKGGHNEKTENFLKKINDHTGGRRVTFHDKCFITDNVKENSLYLENIIRKCKEKKLLPCW